MNSLFTRLSQLELKQRFELSCPTPQACGLPTTSVWPGVKYLSSARPRICLVLCPASSSGQMWVPGEEFKHAKCAFPECALSLQLSSGIFWVKCSFYVLVTPKVFLCHELACSPFGSVFQLLTLMTCSSCWSKLHILSSLSPADCHNFLPTSLSSIPTAV